MVRTVRKEIEGSGTVAARVSGGGVVPGAGVLRGSQEKYWVLCPQTQTKYSVKKISLKYKNLFNNISILGTIKYILNII